MAGAKEAIMKCIYLIMFLMLTSCLHTTSNGFYRQSVADAFDIHVDEATAESEESFYRGAFEICKNKGNKGFRVTRMEWQKYLQGYALTGSIKCTGKIDELLVDKYTGTTVKIENSDIVFKGGKIYRITGMKSNR